MADTQGEQYTDEIISIAGKFVNSTSRHIFLTGKAGTGKTTFLNRLSKRTHKKHLIVAPTGIAALNAGGVTIHSQFLFPFGSYCPDENAHFNPETSARFFTSRELIRRHPLNSIRNQVLRDIELLIIDEVSMLRADMLDAIDFRLRSTRRNHSRPFGGVQLLLIGDLFQLPPIVNDQEWSLLRRYYPSIHFFSSQALRKDGYVFIELQKVFRQVDSHFIDVLNNLRNNICTPADFEILNACYKPSADAGEGVVTLTTHNHQANSINQKALDALPGDPITFEAEITGNFPDNIFPLPEQLTLKEGAQVMFIKNDPDNNVYNGKLARVSALSHESVTVIMNDDGSKLTLAKKVWENVQYKMNEDKELEENTIGTFTQYPIKLAWAITVHKSQGLTFDKAIVDVGKAFAPGQVYVALSRLRSLEGLTLRTPINPSVVSSDAEVVDFQRSREQQGDLNHLLKSGQSRYLEEALHRAFNFLPLERQLDHIQQKNSGKMVFTDADMREALPNIRMRVVSENKNTQTFRRQLTELLHAGNYEKMEQRIESGKTYYLNFLFDLLYQTLLHKEETAQFSRTKTYVSALAEAEQLIVSSIAQVQKSTDLFKAIQTGKNPEERPEDIRHRKAKREAFLIKIHNHIEANPRKGAGKSGKSRLSGIESTPRKKAKKGATYEETYRLLKDGLTIEQIAVKRSLTTGTIESHVARGVAAGKVNPKDFMDESQIEEIREALVKLDPDAGLSEVFANLEGKYSYGQLRIVRAMTADPKTE